MKKLILPLVLAATLFLTACDVSQQAVAQPQQNTYKEGTQALEATQRQMINSVPIPQIKTSEERRNVAKRAERFNSEDKISYIYLVDYGKVMAFYTVKGKVSSLRSYMAPVEQLVDADGKPCKNHQPGIDSANPYMPCYLVEAPDIDGTYGDNMGGIFFFTTEDVYVEWFGHYMMSDQPLKLTTPPELVRQVQ